MLAYSANLEDCYVKEWGKREIRKRYCQVNTYLEEGGSTVRSPGSNEKNSLHFLLKRYLA